MIAPIEDESEINEHSLVKAVVDKQGHALYFSRAPIPFAEKFTPGSAYKHIGLYVYRSQILKDFIGWQACELENIERLEQLRLLHYGVKILTVIVEASGVGVDTEEDLRRVKGLMK